MRFAQSGWLCVALAATLSLCPQFSQAAVFTVNSTDSGFTSFVNDNDVSAPIDFSTVAPFTQIDLSTSSYAAGNFDLTVALFDKTTGQLKGQSLDIDSNNGLYDDVLSVVVPTGDYSLYVTQYDNLAQSNLAQGFLLTGAGNEHYTDPGYAGAGGAFTDIPGNVRATAWNVTVSTVAVPEAPSALLVLPGLIALVGVVRRRTTTKG